MISRELPVFLFSGLTPLSDLWTLERESLPPGPDRLGPSHVPPSFLDLAEPALRWRSLPAPASSLPVFLDFPWSWSMPNGTWVVSGGAPNGYSNYDSAFSARAAFLFDQRCRRWTRLRVEGDFPNGYLGAAGYVPERGAAALFGGLDPGALLSSPAIVAAELGPAGDLALRLSLPPGENVTSVSVACDAGPAGALAANVSVEAGTLEIEVRLTINATNLGGAAVGRAGFLGACSAVAAAAGGAASAPSPEWGLALAGPAAGEPPASASADSEASPTPTPTPPPPSSTSSKPAADSNSSAAADPQPSPSPTAAPAAAAASAAAESLSFEAAASVPPVLRLPLPRLLLNGSASVVPPGARCRWTQARPALSVEGARLVIEAAVDPPCSAAALRPPAGSYAFELALVAPSGPLLGALRVAVAVLPPLNYVVTVRLERPFEGFVQEYPGAASPALLARLRGAELADAPSPDGIALFRVERWAGSVFLRHRLSHARGGAAAVAQGALEAAAARLAEPAAAARLAEGFGAASASVAVEEEEPAAACRAPPAVEAPARVLVASPREGAALVGRAVDGGEILSSASWLLLEGPGPAKFEAEAAALAGHEQSATLRLALRRSDRVVAGRARSEDSGSGLGRRPSTLSLLTHSDAPAPSPRLEGALPWAVLETAGYIPFVAAVASCRLAPQQLRGACGPLGWTLLQPVEAPCPYPPYPDPGAGTGAAALEQSARAARGPPPRAAPAPPPPPPSSPHASRAGDSSGGVAELALAAGACAARLAFAAFARPYADRLDACLRPAAALAQTLAAAALLALRAGPPPPPGPQRDSAGAGAGGWPEGLLLGTGAALAAAVLVDVLRCARAAALAARALGARRRLRAAAGAAAAPSEAASEDAAPAAGGAPAATPPGPPSAESLIPRPPAAEAGPGPSEGLRPPGVYRSTGPRRPYPTCTSAPCWPPSRGAHAALAAPRPRQPRPRPPGPRPPSLILAVDPPAADADADVGPPPEGTPGPDGGEAGPQRRPRLLPPLERPPAAGVLASPRLPPSAS
eukprot:tig00000455_g1041.t1